MRRYEGPPVHRGEPGRFDGVLLYFWPGLAARVEPGRTSNGRYGDRLVRMLLSFQRPSRPCGQRGDSSGMAQLGASPSGQWSVAHGPALRKAREAAAAAHGSKRRGGASDDPQAAEPALAELQHAAVELACGHVQSVGRHGLAIELDAALRERPPGFR